MYDAPFFGVDQLPGESYAMKETYMALIPERATIMPMMIPQVSDYDGMFS